MTKAQFENMRKEVLGGNNQALAPLQDYQQDCIRMLNIKSSNRCDADQAYDLFIDAVIDFRKNILQHKVKHQNIGAYLKRICWNKWLALSRQKSREERKSTEVRKSLYPSAYEPQIKENDSPQIQQKISRINQAMQLLSEKCRRLLHLAIIEEVSMIEIAAQLQLANANVAKTTKSRCYKQLIQFIKSDSNGGGQ